MSGTLRTGFTVGILLVLGLSAWAWNEAQSFRREGAIWPQFLALVVIVSGAIVLAAGRRTTESGLTAGGQKSSGGEPGTGLLGPDRDVIDVEVEEERPNRSAEVVGLFVLLFIILAQGIGFILAAPLYTAAFMLYRGYAKRPLLLVSIVAGLTVTIYLLFYSLVGTPLYRATWLNYRMPF